MDVNSLRYSRHRKLLGTGFGATLLLLSFAVRSAELRDIAIDRVDERYTLRSETYFEVEQEALYAVLSNFELFEQFSSSIVESRNTEPDDLGRPGFFARMEGCVLLFCKSFVRQGYVLLDPVKEIVAVADAAESDFEFSHERWQLIAEGDGTIMIYDFELVPSFWVPPVIGPLYIQHALRGGAERAVDRIEALAFSEQLRNKAAKAVDSQ